MTVQFRADRISYAINCLRIDHRLGRIRRTKRFVAALPPHCHRIADIADIAAGPVGVTRHVRPSLTPATMRQERRSVTFAPRRRCPRRVARAGVPACRGRRACAAARRSFNHRRGQAMRRAPRVGRRSHVAQRLAPASSAPAAAGRDGYVRLSLPQLARVSLAPICAARTIRSSPSCGTSALARCAPAIANGSTRTGPRRRRSAGRGSSTSSGFGESSRTA